MLKQLKLCFRRSSCCCAEKHSQGHEPSEKSFRRPTCHAYDYAALIVPTAVCICIGMHAVKRRNRTHEIHNLHKTHRPRSLQNALSVAPAQAGARPEAQLQLFEHFGESQHAQTTEAVLSGAPHLRRGEKGICTRSEPSEKRVQTAYVPCGTITLR